MATSIPLSQGKFTIVDDEDFEFLSKFKWCVSVKGRASYAIRNTRNSSTKMSYMHREIMNPPVGYEVDHINGDSLDNRRSNLRVCTKRQNRQNVGVRFNSSTGFRGVSFHRGAEKYMAYIWTQEHRRKYLGLFDKKEDAAAAYNRAAKVLFGEFARLNEVP